MMMVVAVVMMVMLQLPPARQLHLLSVLALAINPYPLTLQIRGGFSVILA